MKKSIIRKYLLLAFILLMTGCASVPAWWRVDGPYERETYAVQLPAGWMMPSHKPYLLLTKDGVPLQSIVIVRSNVARSLNNTKKKFTAGMMPQEAAETFLDNAAASENISNFEILENRPVNINGISCFRAAYVYKDKDRLRYKGITYGFVREGTFYDISYIAPVRYYFDKDVKTFEKFAQSFRLVTGEREVEEREEKTVLQGESGG